MGNLKLEPVSAPETEIVQIFYSTVKKYNNDKVFKIPQVLPLKNKKESTKQDTSRDRQ